MEPFDFANAKLDFSEFHPLDHGLLACRGYPGGRRTHLGYAWDYVWGPKVRRRTVCRLGIHDIAVWYGRNGQVLNVVCVDCDRPATPAQRKAALIDERNAGRG